MSQRQAVSQHLRRCSTKAGEGTRNFRDPSVSIFRGAMESKGRMTDHQPKPWSVLPLLLPVLWVNTLTIGLFRIGFVVCGIGHRIHSRCPRRLSHHQGYPHRPICQQQLLTAALVLGVLVVAWLPWLSFPPLGCCTGLMRRRSRSRMAHARLPCVLFTLVAADAFLDA
jgi:hypothetical protein